MDTGVPPFDPVELGPLTFEKTRYADFTALRAGVDAGRRGGAAPAVYNAANEQAVALFLDGRIGFLDIPRAIDAALAKLGDGDGSNRDALLIADECARRTVREMFGC